MTFPLTPEQLRQINRLALEARFVSGMAHELNNSMQVMSGLVELLVDRPDLPDEVRSRLQKIGGQIDRASAVVRQVLTYTRDEGRAPGLLDMGALVDRAIALRRYRLGRAGIEVLWDREAVRGCFVRGDDRQLQQVVLNLLVNAEEALTGAAERRLRVSVETAPPNVRVVVSDTGPGVPPEMRDRIFEPFFSTRLSDRNVGLGLTASANIAAAHDGRLSLEDRAAGATLVLELPAAG
jgi:signal transduction histidine kinase